MAHLLNETKRLLAFGLLLWCVQSSAHAQSARWLVASKLDKEGVDKITSSLNIELAPLNLGSFVTLYTKSGRQERVFSASYQYAGLAGKVSLDDDGVRQGTIALSLRRGILQFDGQIDGVKNAFDQGRVALDLSLPALDWAGAIALDADQEPRFKTQVKHRLDSTTAWSARAQWAATGPAQAILTMDYELNEVKFAFSSTLEATGISGHRVDFQAPIAPGVDLTMSATLAGARRFEADVKADATFMGSSLSLVGHYDGVAVDELEIQWMTFQGPYKLDARWMLEAGFLRLGHVGVAMKVDQFSCEAVAQFDASGLKGAGLKAGVAWGDYAFSADAGYTDKGFKGATLTLGKRFAW